jgi:two-component system sensor histidine kinase/response regulator
MMIWTLAATPPWRVTAVDRDRDSARQHHQRLAGTSTDTPALDSTIPDGPFLDVVAPDDRGAVVAALAIATTQGAAQCVCRVDIGGAISTSGQLDLVGLVARDGERQIVAIWNSDLASGREAPRVVDDQTMRQFLGQVSHDLRTPLNGVLGMTRLLLDSGLRADQVDYARAIDTSGEHLLFVIEDLLEFATLDTKTALHPVDFSPRTLIEDVLDSLTRRAAEKDVEVCALVSARVPELVYADPARLRQVLSYLVSDGIAWTGLGDVIVRVTQEGERLADGDVILKFEVTANDAAAHDPIAARLAQTPAGAADLSAGARTDTRSDAWTPYRPHDWARDRAHDHAFDVSPRAAVCRHLVTLMGGTLGSSAHTGTGLIDGHTWWFTAQLTPKPMPPATIPGYVSLAGRRVLCVDDHPVSQRVLLERLRGWNLQAEATDEAHGALTLMKVASSAGTPFDLAILDLRLPGMDGLALARLIKADPALAATKLVLLTGYPARGQAALAREAGIDAYLQKPIREAPLRDSLETLLGGAPPHSMTPLLGSRHMGDARSSLRPRVLVAEDNPINQKVAVQMLEKLGCRVDIVVDGREAIDAVTRTAYHLVLMDCQMNGMDGIDAARHIRSLPDHVSSPPIVALTGETRDEERMRCLAAGMNDFLSKPLRLGTLREKLAQWIESAPQSHPHHLPG